MRPHGVLAYPHKWLRQGPRLWIGERGTGSKFWWIFDVWTLTLDTQNQAVPWKKRGKTSGEWTPKLDCQKQTWPRKNRNLTVPDDSLLIWRSWRSGGGRSRHLLDKLRAQTEEIMWSWNPHWSIETPFSKGLETHCGLQCWQSPPGCARDVSARQSEATAGNVLSTPQCKNTEYYFYSHRAVS